MTELIFANPRRKSRKGKMPAALKRYWASRRGRKSSSRKRKSSRRRSSARGVTVVTVNRNPAAPAKRVSRFRRSGSRIGSRIGNLVPSTLLPAAIGAAGAVGIDMLWGYLPVPASLQSGPLAPVARIGLAIGVGMVASKFAGRKFGQEVAVGAVTVTVADLAKNWLQANAQSQQQVSGMGLYASGQVGRLGLYASPGLGRLGYRNAATLASYDVNTPSVEDFDEDTFN